VVKKPKSWTTQTCSVKVTADKNDDCLNNKRKRLLQKKVSIKGE